MQRAAEKNPILRLLFGLAAAWITIGPAAAQEGTVLESPPETKAAQQKDKTPEATPQVSQVEGDSPKAGSESKDTPEFMRVEKDGKKLSALQTAVATYRIAGEEGGVEVALIGAVHIAEASYYSELNQLFRSFDSLLYEMVMDPKMGFPKPEERGVSPVSTIQVGMKDALGLTFQLDEVDYSQDNFVHADMTPTEFFDSMEKRKEGVFTMLLRSMGAGLAQQSTGKSNDVELMAALLSGNKKGLRRAFAAQMELADGQMAALTGKDGKSVLITERNDKAFEVLREQIEAGKKKIGVFYGAGHLKDMHEKLEKDFGMELIKTEWMDAWNLK